MVGLESKITMPAQEAKLAKVAFPARSSMRVMRPNRTASKSCWMGLLARYPLETRTRQWKTLPPVQKLADS
jgi:hypothetical protein